MKITETKLRNIIRESLLKEDFLTSAITDVNTMIINVGSSSYNALVLGKGKVKGEDSIVVTIQKKYYDKHKQKLSFLKPLPYEDIKVKHFGAEKILGGDATKKRAEGSAKNLRVYAALSKVNNDKNIKFSKEKLETGAASMADYAVEIGGILGGIPAIGNAADIGAGIIAAIKDPPDYILSALSFLCSVPAIGIGVAMIAKPIAAKFGAKGAKVVGQQLGKELREKGIATTPGLVSKIKSQIKEIFDSLKSKKSINTACGKLNESNNKILLEAACAIQFDPFTEAIAKVEKEIDEIIEGLIQSEQKTIRGLKKSADSADDVLRSKSSKKIDQLKSDASSASKGVKSRVSKEADVIKAAKEADQKLVLDKIKVLEELSQETTEVITKINSAKVIKKGSKRFTELATKMGEVTQPFLKVIDQIKVAQKEATERLAKATEAGDVIGIQREQDVLTSLLNKSAENTADMTRAQNNWLKKSIDETGEITDIHKIMMSNTNESMLAAEQASLSIYKKGNEFIENLYGKNLQSAIRKADYDLEFIGKELKINTDFVIDKTKREIQRNREKLLSYSNSMKEETDFFIAKLKKQKKEMVDQFVKERDVFQKQFNKGREVIDAYKKDYQNLIKKFGEGKFPTPAEFEKTYMKIIDEDYLNAVDPLTRANIGIQTAKITQGRAKDMYKHIQAMMDLDVGL